MSTANHIIQDPVLTDLGHQQCQTLRANFPHHANIDLVTASPLRRTLYTALESFAPVFESNPDLKIIALPDIQETSDVPCDTGSDPSVLKEEFKTGVDLDLVQDGWNNKVGFSLFCNSGIASTVFNTWCTHICLKKAIRSLRANQQSPQRTCSCSPSLAESTSGEGNCHGHARRFPALFH